jgi:hypothetical protein
VDGATEDAAVPSEAEGIEPMDVSMAAGPAGRPAEGSRGEKVVGCLGGGRFGRMRVEKGRAGKVVAFMVVVSGARRVSERVLEQVALEGA